MLTSPFIGPGFAKVVQTSADISEVYVEDFFSFCEIFDDGREFFGRVFQSFGGHATAEIESVIGTVNQFAESLQALKYGIIPLFYAV